MQEPRVSRRTTSRAEIGDHSKALYQMRVTRKNTGQSRRENERGEYFRRIRLSANAFKERLKEETDEDDVFRGNDKPTSELDTNVLETTCCVHATSVLCVLFCRVMSFKMSVKRIRNPRGFQAKTTYVLSNVLIELITRQ